MGLAIGESANSAAKTNELICVEVVRASLGVKSFAGFWLAGFANMEGRTHVLLLLVILFGLSGSLLGCGKPNSGDGLDETATPVLGGAVFGSQCPFGSVPKPYAVRVALWDCPIKISPVELAEPLRSLILQADCKKKTLSIRSMDRAFDSSWELMPDGSFYLAVDGGKARLKTDGSGNDNCSNQTTADLFGKVDCTDRDKAIIRFETIWWLGKSTGTCNLPKTCYFHTATQINQCN